MRYSHASLHKLVAAVAEKAGMPPADARILADSLIHANLIGVDTHGVTRLAIYVKRIKAGLINPRAEPDIRKTSPSVAVVDGRNGVGQVIGTKAMETAVEMARETGAGLVTARASQHFGTCSFYCMKAVANDMIGIAFTNAEPAMVPWGSRKAYFGTNPIALAAPTGGDFPVIIDLATSVTARGKIIAAAKKREKIPLGWAIDPDGNPTEDPEKALVGAVLTMAGHKGYALAFMVEILTGVLSGSGFGTGVGSMYKDFTRTADVGHFLGAVNVESFMPVPEFKARMDRMIAEIKSADPAPDFDEVLVPGEIEHRNRLDRETNGIAVPPEVIEELKALCAEYNVEFNLEEKGDV